MIVANKIRRFFMKNNFIYLLTLLVLTCLGTPAFAGNSGGGGNVGGSTKTEVLNAIKQMDSGGIYNFLPTNPMMWFAILKQARTAALSGNADIEALLDKMFVSSDSAFQSTAIYKDWLNTSRNQIESGPCSGDGAPSDASVGERKLGSPVCVSVVRLQRLPKSSLGKEIDGLMAHEFAHHFGADETLARNFQRYFMDRVERLVRYAYASYPLTGDLGVYELMNRSLVEMIKSKTVGAACASLGSLSGFFLGAMRSSDVVEYSDMNDIAHIGKKYADSLFGARDFSGNLLAYCDKDAWTNTDRKEVTALAYRLAAKIKATESLLPVVDLAPGSYEAQGSSHNVQR